MDGDGSRGPTVAEDGGNGPARGEEKLKGRGSAVVGGGQCVQGGAEAADDPTSEVLRGTNLVGEAGRGVLAEAGGEKLDCDGGVSGRGGGGGLLLLAELCPQHGPQVADAEGQPFITKAEEAADQTMQNVQFPSTDIRCKRKEDIVPEEYKELTRAVVPHFNEFARQKRGGIMEAPEFPLVDYCLFCSVGKCYGGACRGPPRQQLLPAVSPPTESSPSKKIPIGTLCKPSRSSSVRK